MGGREGGKEESKRSGGRERQRTGNWVGRKGVGRVDLGVGGEG